MSSYDNVKVLLLQWQDDDLKVDREVERLENVFGGSKPHGYNFHTERWSIPSRGNDDESSEDLLTNRIMRFRRGATEQNLLTIYYGGHGDGTVTDYSWSANQRPDASTLHWHSPQSMLLNCPAHVLIILDSCLASSAASIHGVGENWLLAATTKKQDAVGVAHNSFTSILTMELERCAALYWTSHKRTTAQMIYYNVNLRYQDLEHDPVLLCLTEGNCASTDLTPSRRPKLVTASTDPVMPSPRPTSSKGPSSLNSGRPQNLPHRPASKERAYAKLRSYDTVFLVDDSGSMWDTNWTTTMNVIAKIASTAIRYDKNGIDVQFFNEYVDLEDRTNLRTTEVVMALFNSIDPDGETPTADKLDDELREYCRKFKANRNIKGLNLIVLTDGDPSPGQDVESVLVKYAKSLADLDAPLLHVGVQFVQIGDDERATTFLNYLDNDIKEKYHLDRDMVDTVHWVEGHEDILHEKILLGGILKRLDEQQNLS